MLLAHCTKVVINKMKFLIINNLKKYNYKDKLSHNLKTLKITILNQMKITYSTS